MIAPLLQTTDRGLYCAAGDFYIDPWAPVERAVITHAHGDHASPGSSGYLTAASGVEVLRERVGPEPSIQGVEYGETVLLNRVRLSLHPAGHVLGSAQARLELDGEVWVFSGDYKTAPDPTCQAFEPLPCHVFITESTFGLPIYRWRPATEIFAEINQWWSVNQERGWTSVLYAYSLGKAQRVLAGVDATLGPILVHGAVDRFLPAYRRYGVKLPITERATDENRRATRGRALVVAPPSAHGTPWLRKFGPVSTAMASGWMQIRGARRRRSVDRGFPLSDHADWDGLLRTIDETGAERVLVTHGYAGVLVRWLREQGRDAQTIATRFEGEHEDRAENENGNQVREDTEGQSL